MYTHRQPLLSPSLGDQRELISFHFGVPQSGEKIYIQASLHADELPGMLTAWHLKQALQRLDAAGLLRGEVILVPVANPIGLNQNQSESCWAASICKAARTSTATTRCCPRRCTRR